MHLTEAQVDKLSRLTSLTVFEIHHSADEIIPAFLLANMMSPALWRWRKTRTMHDASGELRGTNRRLKDLQRQFHGYTFTNDESKPGGDHWGLLNFDDEERRLGKEFIEGIRKDYDETLHYLLKLDPESQFGRIVLQDFYRQGYFPRLKNETVEGMDAYRGICPQGKGSGKCVAMAMLWASSLAVCCRFPLDQIIIVANKAHLFVFLDDGESVNLFNNAKWYNRTRINNGSNLSEQARTVTTGSDVMFIYIPGLGMCDIFNKNSEIERSVIEDVADKCSDFLGAPLRVGDLANVDFHRRSTQLPDPANYITRENYQATVYELSEYKPESVFTYSKYAFRDWIHTELQIYAHASLREYHTGEMAKTVRTFEDALLKLNLIEGNCSIFESRDRLALPDETLLFKTGDDRDKALFLFALLYGSPIMIEGLQVGFSASSSYVYGNGLWYDVNALSGPVEEPEGLTHLFDHKSSRKL